MTGRLKVAVYGRDYTTLSQVITDAVHNLRFSTRLPGGFYLCSFVLQTDLMHAWDWLQNKSFYHLEITDGSKSLWEGRIEDVEIIPGGVLVVAYGYYSNLSDIPYATAYNAVWSTVLDTILTANCSQISATRHFTATDRTANSAAGDEWLDKAPMELLEMFLKLSDSTNKVWDFAVWEDREAWLSQRNPSSVNWLARLGDFNNFRLKYVGKSLHNSAYTVYQAGGATARTAVANDTTSQTKYGLTRRYAVPQMGAVALQEAETARDAWIQKNKDLWPVFSGTPVLGRVINSLGVPYPVSWIRAGEVLRVRDLVPTTGDLSAVALNARQTFFVVETEYDAESNTISLTFDRETQDLVSMLAKAL